MILRHIRTIVAFLVAPLATPVLFFAVAVLSHDSRVLPQDMWAYLAIFGIYTYPSVLVFGVPAYLLYRRRGITSVPAYMVGGALIGLATAAAWLTLLGSWLTAGALPTRFVLTCIAAGALAGMCFRIIAQK